MRNGQHDPSLRRNFLSSEEHKPKTGESDHSHTYADDKQQQNGWAWLGFTGFNWCFDNDAVLLLHHDCDLKFLVRGRRDQIPGQSQHPLARHLMVCLPQHGGSFSARVQLVCRFIGATTRVVGAGWDLLTRISFRVGCLCGHKISFRLDSKLPGRDGSYPSDASVHLSAASQFCSRQHEVRRNRGWSRLPSE